MSGRFQLVMRQGAGWARARLPLGFPVHKGASEVGCHEFFPLSAPHSQAPLRLRTGVLLYGPPGCGKTHIVAAAVAAAGVRCITVRWVRGGGRAA